MNTYFFTPADEAYSLLGVKKPGQKWYAFDGSMDDAKKGHVTKFVMTVWNFHPDSSGRGVGEWAILLDKDTGTYWYRVVREKTDQDPKNRTALWNALHIAHKRGLLMQGMLKDQTTRRCSLTHIFAIVKVMQQNDGSALWLQLDPKSEDIGTQVRAETLPQLVELSESTITARVSRSPKLSFEQYSAGCEWARKVYEDKVSRAEALSNLEIIYGINRNSAGVLLNNYRCLVEGVGFKAPMSADAIEYYVDEIVSRYGDLFVEKAYSSIKQYSEYALLKWGNKALKPLEARLRAEVNEREQLQKVLGVDVVAAAGSSASVCTSSLASEVLREVWVRGPQHAVFRRALVQRWGNRCAVHGLECNGQLRASHIVAWSIDRDLRGDPNNGLLLSVPLDCLFDRGLISFDDEGRMLKASTLELETSRLFGLASDLRLAWDDFSEEIRHGIRLNLRRHRDLHSRLHQFLGA